MTDYFRLLGLEPAFELDQGQLAGNYRAAARLVHPDRFAGADSASQRQALEQSASLNQAYDTLKHSTSRALYLLDMQQPLAEETTVQDPEFLFQQMQWREELEELQELDEVDSFRQRLVGARRDLEQEFAGCWDDPRQRAQAEILVRRMQFLDKVLYEAGQLEERLDDF